MPLLGVKLVAPPVCVKSPATRSRADSGLPLLKKTSRRRVPLDTSTSPATLTIWCDELAFDSCTNRVPAPDFATSTLGNDPEPVASVALAAPSKRIVVGRATVPPPEDQLPPTVCVRPAPFQIAVASPSETVPSTSSTAALVRVVPVLIVKFDAMRAIV